MSELMNTADSIDGPVTIAVLKSWVSNPQHGQGQEDIARPCKSLVGTSNVAEANSEHLHIVRATLF